MTSKPYYTELEYLESDGNQCIETGWSPTSNNLRTRFKAQSLGSPLGTAVCGLEKNGVTPRWIFILFGQSADSTKTFPLIGNWNNKTEGFTFTNGSTLEIDWTTTATSTTITDSISNVTYSHTYGTSITFSNNDNTLKLFQNGDTQKSSIRLYYYQIYDNNNVVHDFIPVLDNDKVPCMYDKVSGQCFYNAGTGNFVAGREIHPVEYLESTGTQYIDTGFVGNQNTSLKIKLELDGSETQTTAVFGSRVLSSGTVDNSFYMYKVYSSTAPTFKPQFGFDTQTYNDTSTTDFSNPIEFYFNKRVVSVNGTTVKTFNSATFTTPSSILLFNCHTGTAGTDIDTRYAIGKLYYCKIWNNDVLVHDYTPAIDENGVGFMFDNTNRTIHDNAGTGTFIAGPTILEQGNIDLSLKTKLTLLLNKRRNYTPLKYL